MRVHCDICGWYSENKTTPQGYALARTNHNRSHELECVRRNITILELKNEITSTMDCENK